MSHDTATEPIRFDTFEAYLAWEQQQPERYELHDGEVVAMAGASDDHNTIADNVAFLLRSHFGGLRARCKVYRAEMKLRVGSVKCRYPDVFVRCPGGPSNSVYHEDARFVVEVVSPEYAGKDLVSGPPDYMRLPSIEQYIVIDSRARAAWSTFRSADGKILLVPAENERIEIPSENIALSFDDVYASTTLDAASA